MDRQQEKTTSGGMKGLITIDIAFFELLRDLRKLQKKNRATMHAKEIMGLKEKEWTLDMHLENILSGEGIPGEKGKPP